MPVSSGSAFFAPGNATLGNTWSVVVSVSSTLIGAAAALARQWKKKSAQRRRVRRDKPSIYMYFKGSCHRWRQFASEVETMA